FEGNVAASIGFSGVELLIQLDLRGNIAPAHGHRVSSTTALDGECPLQRGEQARQVLASFSQYVTGRGWNGPFILEHQRKAILEAFRHDVALQNGRVKLSLCRSSKKIHEYAQGY